MGVCVFVCVSLCIHADHNGRGGPQDRDYDDDRWMGGSRDRYEDRYDSRDRRPQQRRDDRDGWYVT